MKKMIGIFCLILVFNITLFPKSAKGQMDPRVKALGSMALYGAAGGLLLGTAALAFDAPGRSPFIGASLGLYAGILFGTYVVVTHAVKKHRLENPGGGDENYYPDTPGSPYETPFSGEGYGRPYGEDGTQVQYKLDPSIEITPNKFKGPDWARGVKSTPLFYFNLVRMNF